MINDSVENRIKKSMMMRNNVIVAADIINSTYVNVSYDNK